MFHMTDAGHAEVQLVRAVNGQTPMADQELGLRAEEVGNSMDGCHGIWVAHWPSIDLLTMKTLRILTIGTEGGESEMLVVKVLGGLFQVKGYDRIGGWVRALGDVVMRKLLGPQA